MAENETEQQQAQTKRRAPRLRRWAGVTLLVAAAVLALLWLSDRLTLQSAEQQLAAIEAARAIPDSENAAVIYNEVLANTDLVSGQPSFLGMDGMRGPWLSEDHPEAAEWLQAHQSQISRIVEASRKQKCRFPIPIETAGRTQEMNLLQAVRQWAQLLVSAANNDMADGRTDAALQKYLCLIRMGAHFREQPDMTKLLVGTAIEALALGHLKRLILQADVSNEDLAMIQAAVSNIKDTWDQDMAPVIEVQKLIERTHLTLLARLKKILLSTDRKLLERARQIYLRILAERRAIHILAGLRRYKDAHGRWPQDLGVLRESVQQEILVDPINGGAFVYKLNENGFTLYSKGQNNIDEDGSRKGVADDWLIWPVRGRKVK
ncbi:MAG TPA: hypothetical protein VMW16_03730 [Sedimentisphaerales bacterium]|nr:hypothetical protein [Sedimentisphaerales bacterium]